MPTTPAPSWLDIIPPIPLARAVPVVVVHDTHPGRSFHAVTLHAAGGEWNVHDGGRDGLVPEHMLRPDLDDPQGFAYALRFVGARGHHVERMSEADFMRLVGNWIHGVTTDADRLALATALAEVSR